MIGRAPDLPRRLAGEQRSKAARIRRIALASNPNNG
jgi:hypothetical protein